MKGTQVIKRRCSTSVEIKTIDGNALWILITHTTRSCKKQSIITQVVSLLWCVCVCVSVCLSFNTMWHHWLNTIFAESGCLINHCMEADTPSNLGHVTTLPLTTETLHCMQTTGMHFRFLVLLCAICFRVMA